MTIMNIYGISKRMSKKITVLAIETSCDETGVAVMQKDGQKISVISQGVASQMDIHKESGGVIPEVAAREHVMTITPMIRKMLNEANIKGSDLDAIAVTVGPGLMPALSVGVTAARALSYAWQKPLVPVHHIEGHIYSSLVSGASDAEFTIPSDQALFPALGLIVSGGHTMLVHMAGHLQYKVLGTTRDDAVGEVFDKVARMIGLPYPGGPYVSKLAETGDTTKYQFPRPMIDSGDLDFSYSGLKTAVFYTLRDIPDEKQNEEKPHIAASFEQAVVDSLLAKVKAAMANNNYKTLLLAGGVAANTRLREALTIFSEEQSIQYKVAPLSLCGDNAVMIGQVALIAHEQKRTASWEDVDTIARVSIEATASARFSAPDSLDHES